MSTVHNSSISRVDAQLRPNRSQQQDAKAWAEFTGCTYTAALRQMTSPMAQGLLGQRLRARQLIAILQNHELIGINNEHSKAPLSSANGVRRSDFGDVWSFNGETDYLDLALIAEFLQMFSMVDDVADAEVHSYSLKHTAENFLKPHLGYVSNGQVIWVAAALGIPLLDDTGAGPNLYVGISETEHRYVHSMTARGSDHNRPKAHHFRPAGYEFVQASLERAAAGETITEKWIEPEHSDTPLPFHEWLLAHHADDTVVGDIANDYWAGVLNSDHDMAAHPADFLEMFRHINAGFDVYDSVIEAINQFYRDAPETTPVRTALIKKWVRSDMETYTFVCPCGDGTIIEDHENEVGFQEHSRRLDCDRCDDEWVFSPGRSVRQWGLLPARFAR